MEKREMQRGQGEVGRVNPNREGDIYLNEKI